MKNPLIVEVQLEDDHNMAYVQKLMYCDCLPPVGSFIYNFSPYSTHLLVSEHWFNGERGSIKVICVKQRVDNLDHALADYTECGWGEIRDYNGMPDE